MRAVPVSTDQNLSKCFFAFDRLKQKRSRRRERSFELLAFVHNGLILFGPQKRFHYRNIATNTYTDNVGA